MTYKVEVTDIGGCGVGTSVKMCRTLTDAVRFVATTSKQSWAGPWRISDGEGRVLLQEHTQGDQPWEDQSFAAAAT